MRRTGVVLLAMASLGQLMWAQPRRESDREEQFLFFEAINLVAGDSTQSGPKSRIDIHYRIDQEFFVPVRNPDSSFHWEFKRRGDIAIELLDSTGASRARTINHLEIGAANEEPDLESRRWHQGIASFDVSPGLYTVSFEVDDLESQRTFRNREKTIRAQQFGNSALQASTPMFVDRSSPQSAVAPQNFGGNLLFGRAGNLLFELVSRENIDVPVRISYTILTRSRGEEPQVILSDSLQHAMVVPSSGLTIVKSEDSVLYSMNSQETLPVLEVILPIATEKLPLRNFDLTMTVEHGSNKVEVKKQFRTVWPDMPMSMKDVNFALDVLRYIVSEQQLDSLQSGNQEERIHHLETFWKSKDKTPGTEFNEVMTQYYRRVDHSMKEFGTLREADGSRSDRGRIYILYGPPTKRERTLDPSSGFQEIWSYQNLDKKFIFIDKSRSGNYVLSSTASL